MRSSSSGQHTQARREENNYACHHPQRPAPHDVSVINTASRMQIASPAQHIYIYIYNTSERNVCATTLAHRMQMCHTQRCQLHTPRAGCRLHRLHSNAHIYIYITRATAMYVQQRSRTPPRPSPWSTHRRRPYVFFCWHLWPLASPAQQHTYIYIYTYHTSERNVGETKLAHRMQMCHTQMCHTHSEQDADCIACTATYIYIHI